MTRWTGARRSFPILSDRLAKVAERLRTDPVAPPSLALAYGTELACLCAPPDKNYSRRRGVVVLSGRMSANNGDAKATGQMDDVDVSADELTADEGDEGEEAADGENADDGDDVEEDGKKKKRKGLARKRRTAADMNLLREPQEVIVELSEQVLLELSGNRKLHQLRYPTFIVCTHPNFQLRAIEGLAAIKGTALKELDLSNNKLMVLDALEQFTTLKTLKATRTDCGGGDRAAPRLRHLDLSHNKLDGIPDLTGFKALAYSISHTTSSARAPTRRLRATAGRTSRTRRCSS